MKFSDKMKQIAFNKQKSLVLAEGTEPRTVAAAEIILKEKLAKEVFLIGNLDEIKEVAKNQNVNLDGVTLIDPENYAKKDEYAAEYFELRKAKGISLDDAKKSMKDVLRFAAMMVRKGDADAMVAGAFNSTGNVLRAAFEIIKTAPGVNKASSCFVMAMQDKKWGVNGNMIFSDCATIPDPDAPTLAEIAIASASSCKTFLEAEPKVAMLSFSTRGSAKHPFVDKVAEAVKIVKEKAPEILVDGEIQADAALVQSVADKKCPGSLVAGKANVLVFPDLQAGNIGYKLVERFANAEAYGPILQGFAKPVSDLSRGCSVEDIVVTSSITLAQVE